MSTNSDISQVYPTDKHAHKFSEIRFSRRRQQTAYGSPVNHVTKNDNNFINYSSVHCYGDGPTEEFASTKTNQQGRSYTEGKDTNLRSSQKTKHEIACQKYKPEVNTEGKQDKRYKLLEWLKSSQAKRDENNRQVFSRWIEKMDNVRPKDVGQPAFYCEYLPHPYDLYTAVNNHPDAAMGTPTVYVGISPFVFPSQPPTNYEVEVPASAYVAAAEKYPPGLMDSLPSETECYFPHEMHSPVSQGNLMLPGTEPNENIQSPDDHKPVLETISTDDKLRSCNPAFYPQIVSSAYMNYSTAPMMIPMSYVPYMPCEQDSVTARNQPDSSTDVCEEAQSKVYTNGQFPCIVESQARSWAPLVETSEAYLDYSTNSPPSTSQHVSSASYPSHYNRYFYQPTYPVVANGRSNNFIMNHVNQPMPSTLNFNMPQWTSLLDEINKEPSSNCFEPCNPKATDLGQSDLLE